MTPTTYATDGYAVIPLHTPDGEGRCDCRRADCASIGKHPRTMNGLRDASADLATVARWWDMWPTSNVGLVVPDDVVVVDIDGPEGTAALAAAGVEMPETATVQTGRGWHYLYRTSRPIAPTVGLFSHVDLRGPGSYIVAPPSRHANGSSYRWRRSLAAMTDAPAWLYERAQRAPAPTVGDVIPTGQRNATLTSLAGSMRRRGMAESAIVAALLAENAERCSPPLPESEVRAIASSVARYEPVPERLPEVGPPDLQRVRLTSASEIKVRPVKWVWQDRLPVGALALLAGREGIAKSTVAYTIAAELTNGRLPGVHAGSPKAVIVAATEDAWEETIVPRLMAAGADLSRVYRVDAIAPDGLDAVLVLPRDIGELEAQAAAVDAAMILLDPLMSRLDGRLDSHKDAEVRIALEPIVAMANRSRLLVLGIIHVNKSGATDPLSMVMGSRAFTAVSRAVLFMMLDPEDPSIRLLGQPKNNLGRTDDLPTLALRIEEAHVADTPEGPVTTGKVVWLGDSPVSIDEALNPSSDEATSKIDEAALAMRAIVQANGGRMLAADAYRALEAEGIDTKSQARMTKARRRAGITSAHASPSSPWYWTTGT